MMHLHWLFLPEEEKIRGRLERLCRKLERERPWLSHYAFERLAYESGEIFLKEWHGIMLHGVGDGRTEPLQRVELSASIRKRRETYVVHGEYYFSHSHTEKDGQRVELDAFLDPEGLSKAFAARMTGANVANVEERRFSPGSRPCFIVTKEAGFPTIRHAVNELEEDIRMYITPVSSLQDARHDSPVE